MAACCSIPSAWISRQPTRTSFPTSATGSRTTASGPSTAASSAIASATYPACNWARRSSRSAWSPIRSSAGATTSRSSWATGQRRQRRQVRLQGRRLACPGRLFPTDAAGRCALFAGSRPLCRPGRQRGRGDSFAAGQRNVTSSTCGSPVISPEMAGKASWARRWRPRACTTRPPGRMAATGRRGCMACSTPATGRSAAKPFATLSIRRTRRASATTWCSWVPTA